MSKAVITCMEPGCYNTIAYDPEIDDEVPLYCPHHRTESGRHSEVRQLVKPEKPEPKKLPDVIMRCPNKKCGKRQTISSDDFIHKRWPFCVCGRTMVYHKDAK